MRNENLENHKMTPLYLSAVARRAKEKEFHY